MRINKNKIIHIIRDDREKNPWDQGFFGSEFTVTTQRLRTGDYTIEGMEEFVAVEKKASWEEIASDVGRKTYRAGFIKSLRRLGKFPVRCMIICDDISKVRRAQFYRSQITSGTIVNWLINITMEYGIPLYCIGKNITDHKYFVTTLFKKIYEYNFDGRLHYHKNIKRKKK